MTRSQPCAICTPSGRRRLLPLEAEGAQPLVETRALCSEQAGRARDVPVRFVERAPDALSLRRVARLLQARRVAPGLRQPDLERNRFDRDPIAAGENGHSFDDVSQLADVARPRVALEDGDGVRI